jgi:hypothetical protein
MIMADVFAVFGTLLATGIAFPGMMLTWRVLLPKTVYRAQTRLDHTPWRCLFVGSFLILVSTIPIIILFSLPWGGFKAMAVLAVLALMAIASLGAAGLALLIGGRLEGLGLKGSPVRATLAGAVALELAAVFPLVGWFFFLPLTTLVTLGAAAFALLGWMPRGLSRPPAPQGVEEAAASA